MLIPCVVIHGFTVNQKECVTQYQLLIQLTTCNMSNANHITHQIAFEKLCMVRV